MEKIICAAIWYRDIRQVKKRERVDRVPEEQYLPINLVVGMVFCGHRHLQCMRSMNALTGLTDYEAGISTQGFLTSLNRFVGREEAGEIALAANQIEGDLRFVRGDKLFSEHLY